MASVIHSFNKHDGPHPRVMAVAEGRVQTICHLHLPARTSRRDPCCFANISQHDAASLALGRQREKQHLVLARGRPEAAMASKVPDEASAFHMEPSTGPGTSSPLTEGLPKGTGSHLGTGPHVAGRVGGHDSQAPGFSRGQAGLPPGIFFQNVLQTVAWGFSNLRKNKDRCRLLQPETDSAAPPSKPGLGLCSFSTGKLAGNLGQSAHQRVSLGSSVLSRLGRGLQRSRS